ncbi:MAG: hypothetical protein FJZ49_00480 [Candidatus Verstraetearchaeota archaeon]|nr:hypothetical protein [Candidatus Verstraetearchaeota archaeon]
MLEWITLAIFLVTIVLMIWSPIEPSIIGGFGVIVMIIIGIISPVEAFQFVDWNILAILIGLWIISIYLIKASRPEGLISVLIKRVKSFRALVFALIFFAGMVTMFVDNVLVVLLFCPIMITICKTLKQDPFVPTILTGLAANLMGTALLLGDITPQFLHSIAHFEFMDFIVFRGKPSAFPILIITFLIVIYLYTTRFYKCESQHIDLKALIGNGIAGRNPRLLKIALVFFVGTIILMIFRQNLGVPLGSITFSGAIALILCVEILNKKGGLNGPTFQQILGEVEWRAVFFYAFLFILVGSLEKVGLIKMFADAIFPFLSNLIVGVPVLYLISASLSTIVEHDAYCLIMYKMLGDLTTIPGFNVYPYFWTVAISSTLASNATIVAAPALYVCWTLLEKAGVKVTSKAFHSVTIKFTLITLAINFFIAYALLVLI